MEPSGTDIAGAADGDRRATLVPVFLTLAALIVGAELSRVAMCARDVAIGVAPTAVDIRVRGDVRVVAVWRASRRDALEIALLLAALSWAVLTAAFCWVGYLAVEPFLRRRWPELLVTWARVVAGEFSDPLVGRDVLIGCAAGCIMAAWSIGCLLVPEWLGLTPDLVPADYLGVAYGAQEAVPILVWRFAQSVMTGLTGVFLLLILRLGLKSRLAAMSGSRSRFRCSVRLRRPHFWLTFALLLPLNALFVLLARACRSARGRRGVLRPPVCSSSFRDRQPAGLVRGSWGDGACGPRGAHAVRVHDRACWTPSPRQGALE
jgi:hypothetical protein